MKISFTSAKSVLLAVAMLMFPATGAVAEDVSLDPAYLIGRVQMGNADASFNTNSISMNAIGGGYTAYKSTSNSSTYQMTVQGGPWNYSVSNSASFTGNGSSAGTSTSSTVYYNNRSLQVSPGQALTNDYVYTGVVKIALNVTGDASTYVYASGSATKSMTTGEKTQTSFSASNGTAANRTAYWYVPVVPNQQIVLNFNVSVSCSTGGRSFSFSRTVDVDANETEIIPLDIAFACPPPPPDEEEEEDPPPTGCTAYPLKATGIVHLAGVQPVDFYRTYVSGPSAYLYTNPGTYTKNYNSCSQTLSYNYLPTTYFSSSADGTFRWPYLGGDVANNRITLNANQTTTKDYVLEGVPVTGEIRFTGTVPNADLNQYTVNLLGESRVYRLGSWTYNLPASYGSLNFTRHKTNGGYKRPSQLDYSTYLSPGDWYAGQWTAQKLVTNPYRMQSDLNFTDYSLHYDGYTYNFGTPIHIDSGVPKRQDFEYCVGSAIFRFKVAGGGMLSNPYISGTGSHKNGSNQTDMTASVTASATVTNYDTPEVEIFGLTGDYTLNTVRVYAQDGTRITYPPIKVGLACNTTKIFDIPGPTLIVTTPQGEQITNAQSVAVTGRAFSGSTIETVTANGLETSLTPVSGSTTNEVAYAGGLPLGDGRNIITITATDVTGAQATEQVIVNVDRWLPTVTYPGLHNGDRFTNDQAAVPFTVTAGDQGFGYTFEIFVDGASVYTGSGTPNDGYPAYATYSGSIDTVSLGNHTITTVVTDRAGNSTTSSVTLVIYEPYDFPPPVLDGLLNQVLEATSPEGAAASYTVTATSACSTGSDLFPAPILTAQENSVTAGAPVTKTFQWSAVTTDDGKPVEYQVQVSNSLDFGTIAYTSSWQAATMWTQTLPMGTWYWRVTARHSDYSSLKSTPAIGNSFTILNPTVNATVKLNIQHHTAITETGWVGTDQGDWIWAGPFEGWDVDRSFLMFDTSSLGAGANITSAKLSLDFRSKDYMAYDSTTNVHESTWTLPASAATYHNLGPVLASQLITLSRPFGIVSFNIRPDYIKKTGTTQFGLAAANEDYDYYWDADPGYYRPTSYLEVTYSSTAPVASPTLAPQANSTTDGESVSKTFQWSPVAAADNDPVQYLVEVSSAANFSTVNYTSGWQSATTWTRSLPPGTWYWRVTARDSVHTNQLSNASASSFSITVVFAPVTDEEPTVTCSPVSSSTFPLGTTTVTCTARDACEGVAEGTFTIKVQDTVPPTLLVPSDAEIKATSTTGAVVTFGATAADVVDPAPVVTCFPASGSFFPAGVTTVTCTAADFSGNTSTGSFTVTITPMDTTPPVLQGLTDLVIEATATTGTAVGFTVTATDDIDPNPSVTCSAVSGATFLLGEAIITCTATDAVGNTSTGSFTVNVKDTTKPLLTAPADISVEATAPETVVAIGQATATDIFDVTITNDGLAAYPVTTTTVTWTATDVNGNSASATQRITVQDTIAPVVTPPVAIIMEATGSLTPITVGTATATDAVGVVSLISDAPATFPVGTTTVTWTAKDAAGNTGTATQTVTVKDTTAPVLDGLTNQMIEAVMTDGAAASFTVTATDTIDPNPAISCSAASGATFTLGETTVTCTATDASGNSSAGSFTVIVQDTTKPVLTVPADITVEATAPETVVAIGQATATDIFDVTITNDGLAAYPVATTTVTWTATDANSNTASATQRITVQDTIAPVVTPPAIIVIEATGSLTPVTVGTATATDAVGVASLTGDAPAIFPLGTTTVTWTAKDAAGNTGTATQTVTVKDTTAPVLEGLTNQVIEATAAAGAAGTFSVTATDLGAPIPVVCSTTSGSTFVLGETTVTCTATDASGNSASGSFTIKVQDTTPPVLTVPETITVFLNTSPSASAVQAFLNGATATDIVDSSVTVTATTPTLSSVGTKVVTFTAVDDFGNTTTRTAVIKVIYGCGDTYLNNQEANFSTPVTLLKPFKLGSTIPVKLHLCDANGADVITAVARLYVQLFSGEEPVGEPIEVTSTSAADAGNYFRVLGNMYMFNLATKPLRSGTYQLQAVLDDGTTRVIPLALKQ